MVAERLVGERAGQLRHTHAPWSFDVCLPLLSLIVFLWYVTGPITTFLTC